MDSNDENDLVIQELSQVYYIAARIRERLPQQVDLEDLVSAGVIGLLEAARSFDSSRNIQFKTFARFRIRGAILDSLRETDWGSRYMRRRGREIAEVSARLEARLRRHPVESEIAEEIESAPDLDDPDPYELCFQGEMKAHLAEAISKLSEREQLILSLYYREELTMKEIAKVVGIALSRVSQIRQATLTKLKASLKHVQNRPVTNVQNRPVSNKAMTGGHLALV